MIEDIILESCHEQLSFCVCADRGDYHIVKTIFLSKTIENILNKKT